MSTPNDFVSILTDLDDGNVVYNLTEQLRRITLAVLDTKKQGALTLKIDLWNEGRILIVKSTVTAKVPQPATESTSFYADEKGYLRKDDPLQVPLRGVSTAPPAPLRTVSKPDAATTPKEV